MQPITVPELDFLPASYRQQTVRRRDRRWRAAVVVGGFVLLAASWIYRAYDHRAARHNFEMLTSAHEAAVGTQAAWDDARQKLELANLEAALVTYLKHPFTTSQTISAIVGPMPESLRLTEIKIVREMLRTPEAHAPPRQSLGGAADVAELRLPAAQADLNRLREEYDNQQIVVLISGDALDGEALHGYIRRLSESDVFVRAELTSLQRDSTTPADRDERSRFEARAVMRPGIGQPGGLDAVATKTQLAKILFGRPSVRAVAAGQKASQR